MAKQVFLLSTIAALLAVSSASFFLLRPSESNQRQQPATRPNWISFYNSNYKQEENSNIVTTTETPEETPKAPTFQGFTECEQQSAHDLRAHPEDCRRFKMCSAGVLISFTCPSGSVFHQESKSCVAKGSYYDTCSPKEETGSVICPPHATDKKAHPKECAQYYHCGSPAQESRWEQHLRECEYPLLFNIATKRCEHYSMVTCGLRREPFDPCEYKTNECGSGHCVPCSVRYPSCRGKQDGMNGWEGRQGSPHYVVCASQRVVYHGMCPQDKGTQIFDHATGTCVMMNAKQSLVRHTY